MTDYTSLLGLLNGMVPLPQTLGITLMEMGPGWCEAELPPRDDINNHIGTTHAGALFTLGEAASGGAMMSLLADDLGIGKAQALAAGSGIKYLKLAKGAVSARAEVGKPDSDQSLEDLAADLLDTYAAEGKVFVPVRISFKDESGEQTTVMTVDWHVRKVEA